MLKSPAPAVFILVMLISACSNKENARLLAENDSLRRELEASHAVMQTLHDVKGLLDTIDISRHSLRSELNQGTTYQDFSARLEDINEHIKKSQDKIAMLQNGLGKYKNEAEAYLMMVDALKGELEIRAHEMANLQKTADQYQSENKGLVLTVKLQEAEMNRMHTQIETKQQELILLEAKVDELVDNFKMTEAEAYYARAKSVEEAGHKTKLAPHRKRETYKEALELYKKAHSLGKEEASRDIASLEKKVNRSPSP